jgi:hypothetical protein
MLAGRNIFVYREGKKPLKVHQIEAVHKEEFYPHHYGAS